MQREKAGSKVLGSLITADFNHDGRPDLAVAAAGSNTVMVLLNTGSG